MPYEHKRVDLDERRGYAKRAKKALKNMTGIFWALIISIPLWLILGIILGIIWK